MNLHETSNWNKCLSVGKTCWRVEHASRAGVLVEVADYFAALERACRAAQHTIMILGWDIDRKERFGRDDDAPDIETFLCTLLENNPDLHIHLLSWDYSFVYAAEREWFQDMRLKYQTHDRLHVKFDGEHPTGGSQHQKVVVIDDRLAFCGGIDLSRWRWDTAEHAPDDPRRVDPDGKPYPPFHDAMMLVDDGAARALGELARERWERCGEPVETPTVPEGEADWPDKHAPLWNDCEVAIARSFPAWKEHQEVREVEQLYAETISAARHYIYIENQYFTSRRMADELAGRLGEESGPDVILVLPHHTGGWLEQVTMDAIRAQRIKTLVKADRYDRLRVFFPWLPGLDEGECISVHAKLMIADDCFVRVGSANASNRSMGLDSECDLALVDTSGDGARQFLQRMLTEHLDCTDEDLHEARKDNETLAGAIDSLRRESGRSLRPLDIEAASGSVDISSEEDVIDPDEAIDTGYLVSRAVPTGQKAGGNRRLYIFTGFVLFLLLLAAAWRWTPLADWLTAERLASFLSLFDSPWIRFVTVTVVIALTTLAMVPLTPMVVAAAILLDPWLGFASSMTGAMISAATGFIIGQLMGAKLLEHYSQSRIHKLSRQLSRRGILAVAVLRMVPIAPYAIVNIMAGASHLALGRFLLGSVIGMVPGIAALSWFSGSLYRAVTNPNLESMAILLGVTALIGIGVWFLRRLLKMS